jgi:magnesium chelatase subunit H
LTKPVCLEGEATSGAPVGIVPVSIVIVTIIAGGDIVIAAMLFMEDHFREILPDLKARRDGCDAMISILSAGEVMTLTRMGRFTMDGQQGGLMALLKRLRGSGKERNASAGARQLKMLRRLPQILRFIPGTAQDVRAYFLTLQYCWPGPTRTSPI